MAKKCLLINRRQYYEKIAYIRFHPERDEDLIEWVEAISALPNGVKGDAVKDVLRLGLNKQPKMRYQIPKVKNTPVPNTPKVRSPTTTTAHLDISSLIEALRNEFLADIRTIVDASISQSLSGVTIGAHDASQTPNQEAEAEDILDSFADLMLE